MADEQYDAIVIGTSQGGRLLPVELAKAGRKVALVERGQTAVRSSAARSWAAKAARS